MSKTNPEEIQNIISMLGRKDLTEGNVRGTHLGKILLYLQTKKTEIYNDTLYKLSLICGMNIRYIRENYLKGLELFGVIKTRMLNNEVIWNWCGDRDFDNGEIRVLEKATETATEYMKRKNKEKDGKDEEKNGKRKRL